VSSVKTATEATLGPGYEAFGRVGQKQRTRTALKAAASNLMAQGRRPTVVEVAEAAGISKSTAYRYFPSQELMHAEVLLSSIVGNDLQAVYAAAEAYGSAGERLDRTIRADHAVVSKHQQALRTGLRAFLLLIDSHPQAPLAPSNRVRYLTMALAPLAAQLPPQRMRRLISALALCVGVEAALVTEVDCNLTPSEAEDVKRWAAAALLAAALEDSRSEGAELSSH
jgi:AcrR family transcriptional regulator